MSEKAVISTGGKQYIVAKGDEFEVELIKTDKKNLDIEPLMIIQGAKSKIGTPTVKNAKVSLEIKEQTKSAKTTSIRYRAKKRVKKTKGHRQALSRVRVSAIIG
jgi:large subunit ribosomal protein L21